tara:strand:+ start:398 stop:1684 length:1287 start_codon:yes stop_codon:yes gene_type:complete
MLPESFLHFVWRYQYFNTSTLELVSGDQLSIIKTGHLNHLAGPDFKEAQVDIEGIQWHGSVEIHVKASDWYAHKHQDDLNYDNVVLHVVWENDRQVFNREDNPIPTLELKGLVKPMVLERYQSLMDNEDSIPCARHLINTKSITRLSMLEKVLVERVEEKSHDFNSILESNANDWEESAYHWLAKGFGFKTNANNMLRLAQSVPLKVLTKHSNQLFQIEALLFGQAGFLDVDVSDEYAYQLQKEYRFLKAKYELKQKIGYNEWHFSKVRPANYPTIRIAQLAALVITYPHIFSFFSEIENRKEAVDKLDVLQSDYWCTHYAIDKKSSKRLGGLTKKSKENIIVNTAIPFLAALAKYKDDSIYLDKALNLLSSIKAESNHITELWKTLGWNVSSAFDSQGLIQLHNAYCMPKKCIECNIGISLVRNPAV